MTLSELDKKANKAASRTCWPNESLLSIWAKGYSSGYLAALDDLMDEFGRLGNIDSMVIVGKQYEIDKVKEEENEKV